jgi:hypothetical protein
MTEAEIKSLIKDTIKKELKDVQSSIDDIKSAQKKKTDEEQVREIVRTMLVNMYKFLWQKSNNYIKQI